MNTNVKALTSTDVRSGIKSPITASPRTVQTSPVDRSSKDRIQPWYQIVDGSLGSDVRVENLTLVNPVELYKQSL